MASQILILCLQKKKYFNNYIIKNDIKFYKSYLKKDIFINKDKFNLMKIIIFLFQLTNKLIIIFYFIFLNNNHFPILNKQIKIKLRNIERKKHFKF